MRNWPARSRLPEGFVARRGRIAPQFCGARAAFGSLFFYLRELIPSAFDLTHVDRGH